MITQDQIETWLRGIASGVIVLDRDNERMARATLAMIAARIAVPVWPFDEAGRSLISEVEADERST